MVALNPFHVAGLAVPPSHQGITATIGTRTNVSQRMGSASTAYYGPHAVVVYTDPLVTNDFFVRVTVHALDSSLRPPGSGTPIRGHPDHGPGAHIRLRPCLFLMAPASRTCGTGSTRRTGTRKAKVTSRTPPPTRCSLSQLQREPTPADHYDVPITIPPFTPIDPGRCVQCPLSQRF